jgi:hypothetical protein
MKAGWRCTTTEANAARTVREVITVQKLFHKWPVLEERGRFVLAVVYGLLVILALMLATGAGYDMWAW